MAGPILEGVVDLLLLDNAHGSVNTSVFCDSLSLLHILDIKEEAIDGI